MNISSAKYVAMNNVNISITAVIDGIKYMIPIDSGNRHYVAITEWVKEGNTIEEAD